MGTPPSMKYLSRYLKKSYYLDPEKNRDIEDLLPHLPWNNGTSIFVLTYISNFISNLEHCDFSDAIMALDDIAESLVDAIDNKRIWRRDCTPEAYAKQAEFSEMLVNSFFLEVVPRFFTVPKLHQLPQSDKHLYPNEIIAGFLDFLLQVLFHETNISEDEVQRWSLLRKELSFLLAVLGDIPFQCTHHVLVEQVTNLLAEFEMLENEAGSLVYDSVFRIPQMEAGEFHAKTLGWFEKVELLNSKIREHCSKFSELPMSVMSRSTVVDSFFIIHSLVEDIENLKNHRLNFSHGDTITQLLKALHGELTVSESFIKVLRDNEEKEGLIQIRDLTYEAEYLINSFVVGNIPVPYVNLRLPSIIHKMKLAVIGLQQAPVTTVIKNYCDVEVSCPTTGNTATVDENHFLDFNDDEIARWISEEQCEYMKILELSYKQLPRKIKPCFLYFAAFPETEVSEQELIWFWIGEGFIQKEGNNSLEETAETYLLDLINRKMVQVRESRESSWNGVQKWCKLRSVFQEFCSRKANEENFLKVTNMFSMYERCQRVFARSTSSENFWRPFGLHCRSYFIEGEIMSQCFQTMALLKVLDLSQRGMCVDPVAFAVPAQLRFLELGVYSRILNKMVANLVNLEVIFVNGRDPVYVPSVVLRMGKLKQLVTNGVFKFEEECSRITETNNLTTLSSVYFNEEKDEDLLKCCPHLHKLNCFTTSKTRFPDVSFLSELESLELSFKNRLSPKILSSKINFPSTIKNLSLGGSGLPWEMMSILGRLPNLQSLKLRGKAFLGSVWETRDGEFQKLKYLKIDWCDSLRLWISSSGHFPALESLVLVDCKKLVEIPSDFGNIQTLQRIEVKDCTKEACLSARQFPKRIQVDIADSHLNVKDDSVPKLTNPSFDDLMDLWNCMEEYFKAGGSQPFINNNIDLPIIDEEEETTGNGFDLRDVLNYMEEYYTAEGSQLFTRKLPLIEAHSTDAGEEMMSSKPFGAGGSQDVGGDEQLISVNRETYFLVVRYAMHFSSNLVNQVTMDLQCIATSYYTKKQYLRGHPSYTDEIKKLRREFSDILVKSFIPQVQRFFQVPKTEGLPDKDDKHLNRNGILSSFIDFLLQMMMFCQLNTDSAEAEQYALVQKELSFILVVLGDIPLQPSTHPLDDQVNNLLAEFEVLANEAGGFLFLCVFPFHPMKVSKFHAETNAFLEMAKLLNVEIKEYCLNFSELPESVLVRPNVVDSFFIVDSLVDDLQSIIKNGHLGSFTLVDSVKVQMKTLHEDFTLSQRFIRVLRDSETNEEKKGLIQIRYLAYEVEYLISSLVAGNFHVWYLNLRLQSIIHKIKLAFLGLQQTKVIKASDVIVSFPTMVNTATIDVNQFLDFNHDVTQSILTVLTGNLNTSLQVISIIGMPGLGKTTTANKLYNSYSSYFDRRAWCVISQNRSVRNLLTEILMCLKSREDESDISKKDVAELGVKIHQTLFGRRYLIVLDDVWHSDVLDRLKIYFPDDGNGSRVIITTRNEDVCPSDSSIYKLPTLSTDQCWNLLEKKVFLKHPCPSQLVGIGKRIAARCSGVPLAVVSIAGVLANLEKEESEWERVEQGLEEILLDDQSDYRKIMELSYQHLPHYLKPCFLSFARYPEDAEISTKELALFWIAQGFILNDGKRCREEIAEMYLFDLIRRSLVIPAKNRSVGGPKTCRIHDLLHDICINKADEENFCNSTKLSYRLYVKHQHLCIPSSSNTNWRPFDHHCRSFRDHSNQSSGFQTMSLLKAVELLPKKGLGPLRVNLPMQLRYLGLRSTPIRNGMLDNLVKLEILQVRGGYTEVVIPSVILRKLKHLFVRVYGVFEEDCNDNISETTNLRSISRVMIRKNGDVEILRKSPHLQTLKCIIAEGCEITFPDLSSFAELESLRVYFQNRISNVEISFPQTIKKLCLSGGRLDWSKILILGELPNLQVLKLEWNAFVGDEWETNDDQFQELRFLKIENLNLKEWMSESSHFSSLEQLVLSDCYNLMEIPSDFGCSPTLQRIEVRNCYKNEVYLSAIEIEQQQLQYDNHIQLDFIHGGWTKAWTKEELMQEYTQGQSK